MNFLSPGAPSQSVVCKVLCVWHMNNNKPFFYIFYHLSENLKRQWSMWSVYQECKLKNMYTTTVVMKIMLLRDMLYHGIFCESFVSSWFTHKIFGEVWMYTKKIRVTSGIFHSTGYTKKGVVIIAISYKPQEIHNSDQHS